MPPGKSSIHFVGKVFDLFPCEVAHQDGGEHFKVFTPVSDDIVYVMRRIEKSIVNEDPAVSGNIGQEDFGQ